MSQQQGKLEGPPSTSANDTTLDAELKNILRSQTTPGSRASAAATPPLPALSPGPPGMMMHLDRIRRNPHAAGPIRLQSDGDDDETGPETSPEMKKTTAAAAVPTSRPQAQKPDLLDVKSAKAMLNNRYIRRRRIAYLLNEL